MNFDDHEIDRIVRTYEGNRRRFGHGRKRVKREAMREAIKDLVAQRDTAWAELREIREAVRADPEESTADEVRRAMALTAKGERVQPEYYYKVNGCPAKYSSDPECICWHPEGAGPFPTARHDDSEPFPKHWRYIPSREGVRQKSIVSSKTCTASEYAQEAEAARAQSMAAARRSAKAARRHRQAWREPACEHLARAAEGEIELATKKNDAEARAERYMSLLAELKSEYFDQRADADCEGDPLRYVPNEEMEWQARIDEALNGSKS